VDKDREKEKLTTSWAGLEVGGHPRFQDTYKLIQLLSSHTK